jgi:uncharacterized ubiquitin-like protein YukD
MPDRHIDISLEFNGQQLDLRVPTAVTLARLSDLIDAVLSERGIRMPPEWRLRLKDKPIALGDHDVVGDFPVGDGDVFEVVATAVAD